MLQTWVGLVIDVEMGCLRCGYFWFFMSKGDDIAVICSSC